MTTEQYFEAIKAAFASPQKEEEEEEEENDFDPALFLNANAPWMPYE